MTDEPNESQFPFSFLTLFVAFATAAALIYLNLSPLGVKHIGTVQLRFVDDDIYPNPIEQQSGSVYGWPLAYRTSGPPLGIYEGSRFRPYNFTPSEGYQELSVPAILANLFIGFVIMISLVVGVDYITRPPKRNLENNGSGKFNDAT